MLSTLKINKCLLKTGTYLRNLHSRLNDFDIEYFCNSQNLKEIEENINRRKGIGDINLVYKLYNKYISSTSEEIKSELESKLISELWKLPNRTHPLVLERNESKLMKYIGEKKTFLHKPLHCQEIVKRLNLVRSDQLGNFSGSKSYYVLGEFANLDRALVQYAVRGLLDNNFDLISVPDIIPRSLVENCGLITAGTRNQIFFLNSNLHQGDMCLSGTAEMALAGMYQNHIFEKKELPIKLAAVSRCYRAETSNLAEERGLYRVHEFTKVEMFLIVTPEQSDTYLEYVRDIQEKIFTPLDLHMQILDMPPHELGAPAYRKYDIEAWLPGRGIYGEISSCSNCTDYQSRRLGIKYREENGEVKFVHTLNGTAAAIPRLLIALTETGQTEKGVIQIPKVLQKYMLGQESIKKQSRIPQLKLMKNKK
ncbi:hypothetical protein HHI36_013258 [Cryptolaemus montrouzieri]|uniref:serine--tRNA ligase n=1 Tax=Cryptolaemus montrouzieri TaxID=559131 RepID=A0ABD2NHS5_9CUCU